MFVEVTLLATVLALLRGAPRRPRFPVRHGWLAVAAFAGQLAARLWLPAVWHRLAILPGYALLLVFLGANLRLRGMVWLLGGLLLNLAVILANGGYMPVDVARARGLGLAVDDVAAGRSGKHRPVTAQTRLAWLGDVIPLTLPQRRLVSVGDLVASAGVFVLVQGCWRGHPLVSGQGRGSIRS